MRIDLPLCNLKTCRYCFDGNCTDKIKYEQCEYTLTKEERPHGEWVLDKEFSFIFNIYECSKCRFNGSKRWHFCPNCGADMRGDEK